MALRKRKIMQDIPGADIDVSGTERAPTYRKDRTFTDKDIHPLLCGPGGLPPNMYRISGFAMVQRLQFYALTPAKWVRRRNYNGVDFFMYVAADFQGHFFRDLTFKPESTPFDAFGFAYCTHRYDPVMVTHTFRRVHCNKCGYTCENDSSG